MKSGWRTAAVVAGLFSCVAAIGRAQTRTMHIGPRLGYEFADDEVVLGAQFSIPFARRLELYPSFDYYFIDPGSLWALNADIKYRLPLGRPNWLYLGGGLNFSDLRVAGVGSTHAGLNLLGGVESLRGTVHPFGEGRFIISDDSRFQLQAGLNITLGGHRAGRR